MNALMRYGILDTPPEAAFDRITALASNLLQITVAMITFTDANRVWIKSSHGINMVEMELDEGLFPTAIPAASEYVIEDTREDSRTRSHPLVMGEFGLRFHAAVPLVTPDGHQLGTLCVMNDKPRQMTHAETDILKNLAAMVMEVMELRSAAEALKIKNAYLTQLASDTQHSIFTAVHDLRTPLSTVTMLSCLLSEQQFGPLNTNQAKMITSICGAAKEMGDQLNDYAKLAIGMGPPS